MAGLYFEDFDVGKTPGHGGSRTVTEMDDMRFSCLTLNVQPLHIDAEFASKTEIDKPVVNSLFTSGLLVGVTVNDTPPGTTIANLGLRDLTFPKPL